MIQLLSLAGRILITTGSNTCQYPYGGRELIRNDRIPGMHEARAGWLIEELENTYLVDLVSDRTRAEWLKSDCVRVDEEGRTGAEDRSDKYLRARDIKRLEAMLAKLKAEFEVEDE